MALDNELKLLLKSLQNLGISTAAYEAKLKSANITQEELTRLTREMQQALGDADGSAGNLYGRLQAITGEMKKGNVAVGLAAGAYSKLVGYASKLSDDEAGILDLNRGQVKNLLTRIKSQKKLLSDLESQEGIQKVLATQDKDLTEKQLAIKNAYKEQNAEVQALEELAKERLEVESMISKNMGVTGALVQGTGALMERLGMRSGIFHDAMEDAAEEMRVQSKLLGKNSTALQRMNIAAKGFAIVAKGFGAALFDPAVLIGKIVDGFINVNKAATELTRLTGQNATAIAGMNSRLATSVDFLETAAEITRQIGMNATGVFSPDDLGAMAEAKNLLGLTAEQAGNLGIRSKVAGTSIDEYKEGIVAATNEYNAANGAVVSHGVVMEDVLTTADSIALSLGANPKALASAAAAARALGMDLAKVDQIAGGLMDFESSIGYELEAQLLTGKNINLSKARELALNNDLEGVSKELAKNGASAAEFSSMNRIQQEALAKALGMSRDDLGKMAQQQLLAAGASIEAQAAARGVSVAQMEQMNIQERIQKSLDKLAQAFAPILDALVPIVETFVSILQPIAQVIAAIAGPLGSALKFITTPIQWIANMFKAIANTDFGKVVIGITLVGVAINKLTGGLQGIGAALRTGGKGILKYGKSLWSAFTNPGESLKKLKDGIISMKDQFKGGLAGKVQSKAGDWYDKNSSQGKMIRTKGGTVPLDGKDKVKELGADKLKDTTKTPEPKASGEKLKEFLTNLAAGLKEMKGKDVLLGALNLIPASIGLVAMIPGALGAMLIQRVNGEQLKESLSGIASGVKEFASAKVMLGALGLIATSAAFVLMIPGAAGMALMGVTAPMAAAGIYALIPALTALGTAMASGVGALGLIALVGLAVGMGAAFALIGAGAMMMGKGIQYAAGGIVTIVEQLSGLITLLPSLFLLGPALMSIAAGLGMIAVAGIAAIPALAALSAFAIVVTPLATVIGSMFEGGEGEGGDSTMAEVSAKLDKLISVVSKGGDVILDGNKVGQALVLGSYKSS